MQKLTNFFIKNLDLMLASVNLQAFQRFLIKKSWKKHKLLSGWSATILNYVGELFSSVNIK